MERFLSNLAVWLGRKLVSLLCIIAVLLGGYWLRDHWKDITALKKSVVEFEATLEAEKGKLADLQAKLATAIAQGQSAMRDFSNLDDTAKGLERAADTAEKDWQKVKDENPWWKSYKNYYAEYNKRLAAAKVNFEARKVAAQTARSAADLFRSQNVESDQSALEGQIRTQESEILSIQLRRGSLQAKLDGDWMKRASLTIQAVLPAALWVLAGVIIAPFLIKGTMFFLIAPLAGMMRPVRILALDEPPAPPSVVRSSVSLSISVRPDQELLVHPDFLQSSNKSAKKRTRWFLNPHIPLSSLASGMVMLTSLRPEGAEPTLVVISATKDPLGEVGIIELPEGAAMVVHPQALAGVIKPLKGNTRITRHWRLGHLHSWLTFQFRYLVFHGPCSLILKGCRGVRVECPDPDHPRMLNQAATIGFSAHFDYSNTRCETFMSYFRGKEDLFKDLFAGTSGFYVYEEMPDARKKTGIPGRGMEGLLDAALKAFGI